MRVEDWSGLGKKTIEHVEDISIKNENKHIIGPKKKKPKKTKGYKLPLRQDERIQGI